MPSERKYDKKKDAHMHTHETGTRFGRLCRKPGCLFTALAECFLKRGCLLNHQFHPDASLAPMAIFKPPQLGPDFSNQHRRNPVLFLAAANPVSHAKVLSGCKDFTHNHANAFPLKIIQTISRLIRVFQKLSFYKDY